MQTTIASTEGSGAGIPPLPAARVLAAMLDVLPTGIALCGPDGRVLFANEAAQRELASARALGLDAQGRLVAQAAAVQAGLRKAVATAMRLRCQQIVDASARGGALLVAVVPLPACAAEASGALLMFSRHTLCSEPALQLVGQLYGLTSSERDVLGALLGGRTVRQVALSRGREISTLRSQVVAIRGKFGQRRVEHVLRQVALMPWPLDKVHAQPPGAGLPLRYSN